MKNILICTHKRWVTENGEVPLIRNFVNKNKNISIFHLFFTNLKINNFNKEIFKGGASCLSSSIIRAFFYALTRLKFHIFKIPLLTYVKWLGNDHSSLINRIKSYFELFIYIFFNLQYLRSFCRKFDEIFVICGYDRFMISIIYACNLEGVKVYEIQHGAIFEKFGHSVYKNASTVPLIIPNKYILWDQIYKNGFDKNLTSDRFLISGYPSKYILNEIDTTNKSLIRVLIAFDNLNKIPNTLIDLIRSNKDIEFILRPHPKSNLIRFLYIKLLTFKSVNCTFNSYKSDIYEILNKVNFSIVDWSSVSILTANYDKISFYYNESAFMNKKLPNSVFIKYVEKEKINETISKHIKLIKLKFCE